MFHHHKSVQNESNYLNIVVCGGFLFFTISFFFFYQPSFIVCFHFTGVWGSAFSILFNRVLGVSNSQNKGPTMEEELGNFSK